MKRFNLSLLTKEQKETRKRILEISYAQNLSHIGSCLSVVDIIDCIYKIKKRNDKFILSNGHAGIALYTILEKYKKIKDKDSIQELHIHPDRNPEIDIHVSSGSLGQGLPIAIGIALANKKRTIYCAISDGECAEGSIWEALRIIVDLEIPNLKIIVNANGWGAFSAIETKKLYQRLKAFGIKSIEVQGHDMKEIMRALQVKSSKSMLVFAHTTSDQLPFLKGQDAHYYAMNENDYEKALKMLRI
ncbi:MAG TPA: 1-deoxy-D-xylulose-5-phosphate synthase N-terminal domain-containing protein [Candidatus Eisenbacteria bacterium]|nr:1-deoxy-D-xylulose-5-phosphate synthase N-terminal domain-containing protein [Candidatus Eisenbacteria bacterium]